MRALLLVLFLLFLPGCLITHGIGIRTSFHGHHRQHSYVSGYMHVSPQPTYATLRMHMVDMQNSLYSTLYVEDYLYARGVEIIATRIVGPYIEFRVLTHSLHPLHHFGIHPWCTLIY